ncbi:hypothetical protein HDF25_003112 [Pedobacter cryoconitis]|uniref:Uncharacterized protein n=1 Tax=Pedobacter cryoconitis TaxID=188932 RepID=A0A7X0J5C4_9SPHI|nr:hypothetical protein [Pedobacter cryoconitis]
MFYLSYKIYSNIGGGFLKDNIRGDFITTRKALLNFQGFPLVYVNYTERLKQLIGV